MLAAHGSVNSGYCLMLRDGHLVYDLNYYGDHDILLSAPLPLGRRRLGLRFLRGATGGAVELFVDDDPVGRMTIAETFEHFVSLQGFDVGADRLSPVRQGGRGNFAFCGEAGAGGRRAPR